MGLADRKAVDHNTYTLIPAAMGARPTTMTLGASNHTVQVTAMLVSQVSRLMQ